MAAAEGRTKFWDPPIPRTQCMRMRQPGSLLRMGYLKSGLMRHVSQPGSTQPHTPFSLWRRLTAPFNEEPAHGVVWSMQHVAACELDPTQQPRWSKICVAGAPLTPAELQGHNKSAMLAEIFALQHTLHLAERLLRTVSAWMIASCLACCQSTGRWI